jgi:hypothetical protein
MPSRVRTRRRRAGGGGGTGVPGVRAGKVRRRPGGSLNSDPDLLAVTRNRVEELASLIDAPAHLLPTYGGSEDGARPHIESEGIALSYVVVERGVELRRDTTEDLDELLYWIFRAVTFSMGGEFELRHRVEHQDFRIIMFQQQLELLTALKPHWCRRYSAENAERLQQLGISTDE